MSFHNELSNNWVDDKTRADVWSPSRKENTSLVDYNKYVLLGESSDIWETSDLDTEQLFPQMETKLYKRRWVMLFIFAAYSMSNAFMWLQYSIISNIFMGFYNISSQATDWLAMVYYVAYILFILPVTWLLDKRGMRDILVLGSALNCIGAWIKTSAAQPGMFAVAFLGQFVCAVASVFVLGIPPRLASLWFGQKEVSTACSIGVLGNQVCLCVPVRLKKSRSL